MDKEFLKLACNLRENRTQLGLSQKQVAQAIDIAYQSYQAYELGIAVPTLQNFVKLCKFFDLTPNDLLDFS